MALTSLLVCADAETAQLLSRVLHRLDTRVEACLEPSTARSLVQQKKFDAVVIDCDSEHTAIDLVEHVRNGRNQPAVVIVVLDGQSEAAAAFSKGANFVIHRPVSAESALHSLRAARSMMLREKRTQHRVSVQAEASVSYAAAENVPATLIDLNENGIAILSDQQLPESGKVYFQFTLPGSAATIRLSGEVMWQDSWGRVGVRFAQVPQASRRVLNSWLEANLPPQSEVSPSLPNSVNASSTPVPAGLLDLAPSSTDRRQLTRHPCRLGAEAYREGSRTPQHCNLIDISSEGCYIETNEPFPAGTLLEIVVHAPSLKLRLQGRVQSMHRGFGMGVQFTLKNADERQQVKTLIECEAREREKMFVDPI